MAFTEQVETGEESLTFPAKCLLAAQHVVVMAATPVTAVFLIARALHFSDTLTASLMSATFLMCGIGAVLQSSGLGIFGARLPFIMVPGGAPIAIFIAIAQQTNIETAIGAVLMTSVFYLLVLPFFRQCIHFFPPFIIGIMLLLVSVNLIRLYGNLMVSNHADNLYTGQESLLLGVMTIVVTLLFSWLFTGRLRQIAVLAGLIVGTVVAMSLGKNDFSSVFQGPLLTLPQLFPYGWPQFNLAASLPLMIYAVISMAEATGQTIATAEIVKSRRNVRQIIPKTIRADALVSFFGGLFGTTLIITSGENIGVVRTTNVKSRHVTALAGIFLIVIALFSPFVRLATLLPDPVVCGTAVFVFSIIGVIGIEMIARESLHSPGKTYALASGLTMGLLPILVPGLYQSLPAPLQMILGNGMAAGTLTAIIINLLFIWRGKTRESAA